MILGLTGSDGESVNVRVFTVSFDSDGGSAVPQQKNIFEGNWARQPVNAPTKPIPNLNFAAETTAGLYRNHFQFDGWYLENEFYNFDTPITSDLTLTARWSNPPVELDGYAGDNILTQSVNYMNSFPGEYTLLLDADIITSNLNLTVPNAKLTLRGIDQVRTIAVVTINSGDGKHLFSFGGNNTSLILDDKITIKGSSSNVRNNAFLIDTQELIMRPGSRIEGHVAGVSATVNVRNSFIMEGGTITGNSTAGNTNTMVAGIRITGRGSRAIISGGSIRGNTDSGGQGSQIKDIVLHDADIEITLSGNADIGELGLNEGCHINIASSNVKIDSLSLGSHTLPVPAGVISAWIGKPFIHAAEGYTLNDFSFISNLQYFFHIPTNYGQGYTNKTRSPMTGYRLVLENGVGVLRAQ